MAYVGPAPANSIIATSDIEDGAVTTAKLGGNIVTPGTLDVNGQEFILDADADSSITADTDDQVDIKVGGTDVVTLTNSSLVLKGTTPTLTIGDAGAEDTKIVFDGNAQDFYIGLDDTDDDLKIGLGSAVGTTTHMSFDETGAVLKPLQPGFFAYPSGVLSDVTGDNTLYVIILNAERFDTNSDHVNGVFTAPVAGVYHFDVTVGLGGLTDSHTVVNIQINTSNHTEYLFYQAGDNHYNSYLVEGSGITVFMDAADTAKMQVNVSGSDKVVDVLPTGNTFFSGYLVG